MRNADIALLRRELGLAEPGPEGRPAPARAGSALLLRGPGLLLPSSAGPSF